MLVATKSYRRVKFREGKQLNMMVTKFLRRVPTVCFVSKCFDKIESQRKCILLSYRYGSQNPLYRRPIRVLTNSSEPTHFKPERRHDKMFETRVPAKQKPLSTVNQKKTNLPAPKAKKSVSVPAYVKLPEVDDRLIKTLTTLKSRNQREKSGKILLEGKRLINDAISAGLELKILYFSREETLDEINLENAPQVELYKILYRTLRVWSGVVTPQGILGVFKQPSNEQIAVLTDPALPVTVLCDNIRDPGNLGSIIRNAAAAGCRNVMLTKGCVDPWEQKVLRTGMGAHFRIPIINNIEWEHVLNYLPRSCTVYLADNSADIDLLDSDIIDEVDYFAEATEKNNTEEVEDDTEEEEEEEERYVSQTEEGENIHVDTTYTTEMHLEKYNAVELPCHLYSSVKFPKDDIVVYVGGETHGLSPQANKLACELGGHRVKIPVENGVDSLNSSYALAIILYEIKRQHKETYVCGKIKNFS